MIDDAELNRRHFFSRTSLGLGSTALASLLGRAAGRAEADVSRPMAGRSTGVPGRPRRASLRAQGEAGHLPVHERRAVAARPVRLQAAAEPDERQGPARLASAMGQRLTGMSANQATLPLAGSIFKFARHGSSGAWVSELLPQTAKVADDLCFVRSLYTEAINHDPAITFFQTGSQIAGRPWMGAWLSYGLGSANQNLPAFCVLISQRPGRPAALLAALGQRVPALGPPGRPVPRGAEPVLYLDNPAGRLLGRPAEDARPPPRAAPDRVRRDARPGDQRPDRPVRDGLPDADLGPGGHRPGRASPNTSSTSTAPTPASRARFAANCLLARRLAERGVRFIQLYHPGWDHHGGLPAGIRQLTRETDQGCAALIQDLKQRGMLDDTLVLWGGEFGRTNYSQGKLTPTDYGRDHHPRCFTVWAAGGGIKPGLTYGETDEFGYNIVADPVHVHDFHATILRLLGIDHERLTFKYQGRYYRLTDVAGKVVKEILA